MTQTERIIRHLQEQGSITPFEALKEYGVMRLASRICDIRRAGYDIAKTMETSRNKYGEKVSYARYELRSKEWLNNLDI